MALALGPGQQRKGGLMMQCHSGKHNVGKSF